MNIKGSAGSLSTVVERSASWIVAYTFNFVTEWSYPGRASSLLSLNSYAFFPLTRTLVDLTALSLAGAFFILAGINAFAVLFVLKLVPETKGRTLEEIQVSLQPSAAFG